MPPDYDPIREADAGVAIIGWTVAAIVITAVATLCILYWRVHHT